MNSVKNTVTKYSGLPLPAVIHLVQTTAPVNELLRREVWKELFYRYFMEGRAFNLYSLLKGKPEMFANTIGWELQREDVAIPVAHAEAFIKALIEFTEYIDRKVLESGVEFEWQLHELQGMKEMMERVRDAKIQDANTRQKINLFIDKVNESRKKSLLLIEQAKAEQIPSVSNPLAVVQSSKEVVVTEKRHELMKQELKRLSIPVSKMTKTQWEDAINHYEMYYPQDQQALIRQGLKKNYGFFQHQSLSLIAFKLNLDIKISGIHMTALLFNGVGYQEKPEELFGSDEAFLEAVREWYLSAEGSTEKGWYMYSTRLLEKMSGDFAEKELINRTMRELEDFYPMVKKYTGALLSEVIQTEVTAMEQVNYTPKVEFDKTKLKWTVSESVFTESTMSIFEKFYLLFNYIRGYGKRDTDGLQLVEYLIELTPKTDIIIQKGVPVKFHAMIRDYCQFPSTITLDEGMAPLLDSPLFKWKPNHFHHDKNLLEQWFKHKCHTNAVSTAELKLLFTTEKGLQMFKEITPSFSVGNSGWLRSRGDYIGKFFERILSLFDFRVPEERERFFQLPYEAGEYFNRNSHLTADHAQMVVDKLRLEAPHEYQLIAEYFSDIELTYEEYVVHPMFQYLSELERLLLEKDGIQTGEKKLHRGYKEGNKEYTSKEAENKFVLEYFQKLHMVAGQ